MPSAANVKIEKQIAPEGALTEAGNSSPLRQAITIIEHKIRNLEKRKSKLESYRDLQRSGKDLNQDQKTAVAKYDEVVQTLEFARDLCKQFLGIAVVSEKDEKKKARKDAAARSQAELAKVREVLLVQDALTNMGQENIRDDFLNGRNGAATLTQSDLKLLDDLYLVATPKHEAGDPTAFMPQVHSAAEHLLAVVDGKQKEVFGSTYSQIKEVIGKIHESGYLDQALESYAEEGVAPIEGGDAAPIPGNQVDVLSNQVMENLTIDQRQPPIPSAVEPQVQQPTQQQPPPMEPPVPMQPMGHEQIYYQQAPPQPRPITEVLGAGSFYFLQDSELDTPPEQIPSQTFTNQTYVAGPPPPIPMPPHFQFPNAPQQQPPPPQQQQQQPPPVMPQQQSTPPQQAPPPQPPQTNNGIGDHMQDSHDDASRQRGNRQQGQQRMNQQQFFTNNNGYNNRPNRNRNNGPRPNTRHNQ